MNLWQAVRYAWVVSRGYRLRPWASPYLRWRMETYFGVEAETITCHEFLRLLWQNRRQLRNFFRWAAEMRQWTG